MGKNVITLYNYNGEATPRFQDEIDTIQMSIAASFHQHSTMPPITSWMTWKTDVTH